MLKAILLVSTFASGNWYHDHAEVWDAPTVQELTTCAGLAKDINDAAEAIEKIPELVGKVDLKSAECVVREDYSAPARPSKTALRF